MTCSNDRFLNKDGGVVVFLGSMNAMPMMYAIELKKLGYDVLYFVDRPKKDMLSRPENHFQDIKYPYPSWIIEIDLKTQIFIPFLAKIYAYKIGRKIKSISSSAVQAFFFNGFFSTLAPYLESTAHKFTLSHGADLDSWANIDDVDKLYSAYARKSIFKFVPDFIKRIMIDFVVNKQFHGMMSCNMVIYFPRGFNLYGDLVIDKLVSGGLKYIERYDVSFEPLKLAPRGYKERSGKLKIFSGVRFTFETFTENNEGYSKGNDKIIYGLAMFYKKYKDIEIHFVEKGEDVAKAKALCTALGLSEAIVWHKEMSFIQLLKLYDMADICFDQVGEHWIGAIGCYALWLGKPLIANDIRPIKMSTWPSDNPVCSAATAEEVNMQLEILRSDAYRKDLSIKSMNFSEKYLGPRKVLSGFITELSDIYIN